MSSRRLGIMQGRLSPKDPAFLQSFPAASWSREFGHAEQIGFDLIEWLVDDKDLSVNPLFNPDLRQQVDVLLAGSGPRVETLCAHVLIDGDLCRDGGRGKDARALLTEILRACQEFSIASVVLPLMDGASVRDQPQRLSALVENLRIVLADPQSSAVLCLEGDLPAAQMLDVLRSLDHCRVGVCYDLGNATAMGFDPADEIRTLGAAIKEVHVKDRLVGGGSKMLGQGDTAFPAAFNALAEINFQGPVILETPVGDDWRAAAQGNLAFLRSIEIAGANMVASC